MDKQMIQKLVHNTGLESNDLTLILIGKKFASVSCATIIDRAIFASDPDFSARWEKRIKLTYDPYRVVLWQSHGVSYKQLAKLWLIVDENYVWKRIKGELWMSEKQWEALYDFIKDRDDRKDLAQSLTIREEQYQRRIKTRDMAGV